jgi:hypothetical protein
VKTEQLATPEFFARHGQSHKALWTKVPNRMPRLPEVSANVDHLRAFEEDDV